MNDNTIPPKTHILLRTKSGSLDMAIMKAISMKRQEKGNYDWHIGISSNKIIMFDIDEIIPETEAIKFAERLKQYIEKQFKIDNKVIIIRTNHGYHIVSNGVLTEEQWLLLYNIILDKINNNDKTLPPFDKAHIELSIKYKSTTLRISPKHKNEIYKIIKVI